MMRPMKDSGIAWIGKIPEGWRAIKFKYFYIHKKEIAGDRADDYERLALTLNGVIKRPKDDSEGLQPGQFDGYQILQEDDFVFKMIDLQNISTSRVGLSAYKGLVSPAYIRFSSKGVPHSRRFFYYFLMSLYYNCVYNNLGGDGVRSALNANDLGDLIFPIPPLAEQQAIADYLDEKCAAIDKLIDNQKVQIEKMKEYKQSVITEAVTKGLNPSVPMKDSGIAWIGKIPEGWRTSRVGLHYDIVLGKMLCSEQATPQHTLGRYYCAANVHFGEISPEDELKEMWFSEAEKQSYGIKEGDLLVVEGGAGAGGCAIASRIQGEVYIQNSILRVRAKEGNDNRYLRYYIESMVKRNYIDIVCNKATIPHFTKDKLGAMPYIVMSLAEQQAIADYLDEKCAAIDKLIAIKQAKIDKLNDYKKSLIYEYVTGKREVL